MRFYCLLSLVAQSSQSLKMGIDKNRQQSSDFYRLITENGENGLAKLLCQMDIIDFWHELDSTAEKTHPRVMTD